MLQSIPVLGFLPGFVLALVHLFPHSNVGLELASVLMIFTGQVWNMTFSFYASLKGVPPDLVAVSRLARMSWWARFVRLDLSYAANGLVWNSMMSMAGGWFFLTVSEAFVLGEHDFRLPGLGSYMSLAIERGDFRAQVLGVLSMLAMIVLVDQIVWRPIVAWAHKFTDEERSGDNPSWLWERLRRSSLWRAGAHSLGSLGRARLPIPRPPAATATATAAVIGLMFLLARASSKRRAPEADASAASARDPLFVSYAHADNMAVVPVVEAVQAQGRAVWIDKGELHAGTSWAGEIVRAIKNAKGVIVMCSAHAFESDHVKREVYLADRYKKPMLPVFIEAATMPEDFEYFFTGVQWLELHKTPENERAAAIANALRAV